MPEVPIWFPGARLNYAENILRQNTDGVAVTAIREVGPVRNYTFRQLRSLVRDMAAAMRVNGLGIGDRVAGEWARKHCRDSTDTFVQLSLRTRSTLWSSLWQPSALVPSIRAMRLTWVLR